ncbi:hypothetical protein [Burkholderia cepacia]|uniref:hypothetical protein n=1 Tax=Burkholderia cepacia TaxID=292 RepID=UPI002AB7D373|nr:hypothetical protein [Burkholderia cepacia]
MLPNMYTPPTSNNPVNPVEVSTPMPKKRKGRFARLPASELAGRLTTHAAEMKPRQAHIAYIQIRLPISGSYGTASESAAALDFARAFDEHSQTVGVGAVSNIAFSNGQAEVVLKLTGEVDPENHGEVIKDAFGKLHEFFISSPALHHDRGSRKATWEARIDGSTIGDGSF